MTAGFEGDPNQDYADLQNQYAMPLSREQMDLGSGLIDANGGIYEGEAQAPMGYEDDGNAALPFNKNYPKSKYLKSLKSLR